MSTNAKPFPLYTDGASVFYTVDGVNFSSVGGGGQDPSNVAITGGSIAGTTINGDTAAVAIARNQYIDAFDAWKKLQYSRMIAAAPALTAFDAFAPGRNPLGVFIASASPTALTGDVNKEGGFIAPTVDTTATFGASVFQNTPGGNWAVCFQVQAALPAAGVDCEYGIKNSTFTRWISFGSVNTWDSTNWQARIKGAGTATQITTTTAVTTATTDLMLTDDGTTVKAWVNGVLAGSTTDRSQLAAAAMQIMVYDAQGGEAGVSKIAFGYVQP